MTRPQDWTDEDRALVREIAFAVGDVIIERHEEICELRRGIKMWKLVAVALASGVLGGLVSNGAAVKLVAALVAGV